MGIQALSFQPRHAGRAPGTAYALATGATLQLPKCILSSSQQLQQVTNWPRTGHVLARPSRRHLGSIHKRLVQKVHRVIASHGWKRIKLPCMLSACIRSLTLPIRTAAPVLISPVLSRPRRKGRAGGRVPLGVAPPTFRAHLSDRA